MSMIERKGVNLVGNGGGDDVGRILRGITVKLECIE